MRTAYKLEDVRLWDIEQARFINPSALALENYGKQNLEIKVLVNSTGEADVPYIIKMLEFYGYPLGELAKDSPEGIKEELAALDAKYLTARTLAGLSTGDGEALSRWREHEEKAEPLRKKLRELETAE